MRPWSTIAGWEDNGGHREHAHGTAGGVSRIPPSLSPLHQDQSSTASRAHEAVNVGHKDMKHAPPPRFDTRTSFIPLPFRLVRSEAVCFSSSVAVLSMWGPWQLLLLGVRVHREGLHQLARPHQRKETQPRARNEHAVPLLSDPITRSYKACTPKSNSKKTSFLVQIAPTMRFQCRHGALSRTHQTLSPWCLTRAEKAELKQLSPKIDSRCADLIHVT